MQLSLLIGKRILTPQGDEAGYVKGAYLSRDLMRLTCLAAVDADEEEFFLPVRAILSCKDAVIAGKSRLHAPTGVPAPIGLAAFSDTGEALGTVCDWLFGDVDPVFLVVKDGVRTSYACKQALSGETVIFYPEGKRPPASKRTNNRTKKAPEKAQEEKDRSEHATMPNSSEEPTVPVPSAEPAMPEEAQNEPTMSEVLPGEAAMSKQEETVPPVTEKAGGIADMGHRNLLGRRVRRTITDEYGMPIAHAGETVTPAVLARARLYNRLLALEAATLTAV